ATPSIIASYNINTGKYVFINQGLKKLLGYDPKQVLSEGVSFFANLIHPDDVVPMMEKNIKALELANDPKTMDNDLIVEFQYRMKHLDGRYRWFKTYGTIFDRNNLGKVEHVLNISLDITDTIEAEQKIREQEYFIEQIADASPTVLYLFHAKEGRVLYINKEVESVIGFTPEEIIDMKEKVIPNLYHPEDALKIGERLHEYKHSENPKALFQFECRMKDKKGKWHWLLVREIVFKHNDKGEMIEILGTALDITNRKEMEDSLFHKTLELQQSNANLQELAYVASHDLKEPLRKISTFGDRLLTSQYNDLNEDGRQYLAKIIDSSGRMQQLIDDLLSVSMISGEKRYEEFSLQKVLKEVLQALEHKVEEKSAKINAKKLPEAKIIPSQFRQLFQNLLSNSLKFSKKDGKVHISISYEYLKRKEVSHYKSLAPASRYLQIKISDNGIGFDPLYSEKIFNIFQRLHSKREYEGTGIGLAICKKIVENHGGAIFASSTPNKGADFFIIIPV
ncbi:MAG: PAS domain-containing protein, partial [Bacteroidota bacterium]|nr:PAS domain-containing protein [Bacteroidota bacterium]